jgi:hypothetical protein
MQVIAFGVVVAMVIILFKAARGSLWALGTLPGFLFMLMPFCQMTKLMRAAPTGVSPCRQGALAVPERASPLKVPYHSRLSGKRHPICALPQWFAVKCKWVIVARDGRRVDVDEEPLAGESAQGPANRSLPT